jgi:hypothetical protein
MIRIDESLLGMRRLPWWQVALITSVGIAIVIALVIVTAGLVLLLAPIIFLAILFRRLMMSRPIRLSETHARSRTQVIEAEYEIIDAAPDPRNPANHQ